MIELFDITYENKFWIVNPDKITFIYKGKLGSYIVFLGGNNFAISEKDFLRLVERIKK